MLILIVLSVIGEACGCALLWSSAHQATSICSLCSLVRMASLRAGLYFVWKYTAIEAVGGLLALARVSIAPAQRLHRE